MNKIICRSSNCGIEKNIWTFGNEKKSTNKAESLYLRANRKKNTNNKENKKKYIKQK